MKEFQAAANQLQSSAEHNAIKHFLISFLLSRLASSCPPDFIRHTRKNYQM